MGQREIQGIGGPRENDEPLVWKPWQPPVTGPLPPPAAAAVEAAGAVAPLPPARRMNTDDLQVAAGSWAAGLEGAKVDFEAIAAGLDRVNGPAAARALGAAGTIAALSEVAAAYARTTFSPDAIAASLGAFADNLARAGADLAAAPGVGLAFEAFGGVGAVAAGVLTLRDELAGAAVEGRSGLSRALGAATGAAKLVGGVSMALGALVAPLAPVGAALLAAGAALELGRLGWDGRDAIKQAAGKAADGLARVVSNNGASMADAAVKDGLAPAKVVANNGARMQAERLPPVRPGFAWLAG